MKLSHTLASSVLVTLALVACQEAPTSTPALAPANAVRSLAANAPRVNGARATLRGGKIFDQITRPGARVINPGDYVCSDASPVTDFLDAALIHTLQVEPDRFFQAYDLAAADLPTYEAIVFQSPSSAQYFGVHGEHTNIIGKTERGLKNFWDIASAGIEVVPMHGSMLLNAARTSATYQVVYGLDAGTATFLADTLRRTLANSQTMRDGNHPFWTFNAIAIGGVPGFFADKIVMGDGIMAAYDAIGFSDVAPQAIFAHEFGHHVQFQKGYGINGTDAEQSRFAELNADALAGYYLTHKRGATMNRKRVEQFLEAFFDIGDCFFNDAGHHGTPNQRMSAARFGFQLADEAQKQGQILTADQFQARFLAAYSTIVAPDAH